MSVMSTVAVALAILCVVSPLLVSAVPRGITDPSQYTFEAYVVEFGKEYVEGSVAYAERKALFQERLAAIAAHNRDKRGSTYTAGVNQFTDWTTAERTRARGGMHHLSRTFSAANQRAGNVYSLDKEAAKRGKAVGALPKSVDYRLANPQILTAIKDQGRCGDCWAHAGIEQLETYEAKHSGNLFVLSTQQATFCVDNKQGCGGVGGCFGGAPQLVYEYAAKHGLVQEWVYPFEAYDYTLMGCNKSLTNRTVVRPLPTFTNVQNNSAEAAMHALAHVGPLSIMVAAETWYEYESGIYDGCPFATQNVSIDHVVQLVGYGFDTELNESYWIVRNSWSPLFGEHGFIRLKRHTEPYCGYSVVNPECPPHHKWFDHVKVCGTCGMLAEVTFPHF